MWRLLPDPVLGDERQLPLIEGRSQSDIGAKSDRQTIELTEWETPSYH
jgi:hypothetical protein